MSDVVVTVPKRLWRDWIAEGDAVGELDSGEEWIFYTSSLPRMEPGERVYVVAHGALRGYSPLVRLSRSPRGLIRGGGAVACTLWAPIRGFQGWRYRWWNREMELPFPEWRESDGHARRFGVTGVQGRLFG